MSALSSTFNDGHEAYAHETFKHLARKGSLTRAAKVRGMRKGDLAHADRIMRLAFGTFIGMPEPESFMGDADYVYGRFASDPGAAFVAEIDGRLLGSNFATNWGSVGFFGPLTVDPDIQDRGVGSALVGRVVERFKSWGTRHAGLYTFAESTRHIGLYHKFGFYPRYLTAIMEIDVRERGNHVAFSTMSRLPKRERDSALAGCRALTEQIYEGLDLTHEIHSLQRLSLGDVVLLDDEQGISAFAVCHGGPRTEAGSGVLKIKFGAVRPGPGASRRFESLLDACEAAGRRRGLASVVGGVNLGRSAAYEAMLSHGYRTAFQGVAMHRPNEPGYSHPEVYLIDDWR